MSTPSLLSPSYCIDTAVCCRGRTITITRNDNHKQLIDQIDVWGGAAKTKPRILCGVYTYEKNHSTKVKVSKSTDLDRVDSTRVESIPT